MRAMPFEETFDRALSWYSSFGYHPDEESKSILREMQRCLKPDGLLLLDHPNKEFVLRGYHDIAVEERDGHFMIDFNSFDALTDRTNTTRVYIRDGRVKRCSYFIRLFTYPELTPWLEQAGFAEIRVFGRDGGEFSPASPRMLIVARNIARTSGAS